jgi:hypothetical protein
MKRMLAITVGLVVAWTGISQAEQVRLSGDQAVANCYVTDPGPGGEISVYVILRFSTGATGISFSAPIPSYAGLQWIGDTLPPGFSAVGTSQTQMDVFFGTCMVGGFVAVEMRFVRVGEAAQCIPYLAQSGATFFNCASIEMATSYSTAGAILNSTTSPCTATYQLPFPANGAVGVPGYTSLDWLEPMFAYCDEPIAATRMDAAAIGHVYFGTTTDPPYHESATLGHYVEGLLPATTYYWRIKHPTFNQFGPLWSFTTAGILATEQSTWGAIKALYR